jgi:TolB-like protein
LVERDQIAKVRAEQTLQASGLVQSEEATRLGNLLRADALLLLDEQKPIQGRKALRVRLVESVTGIKLLDEVLPAANLDRQVQEIVAELDQAGKKLAVPETERRYLGIVAIQSEEPGESLAGMCRTLAALVESRLQQLPKVVVLERESLGRLTDESKLTGSELRLRGSAWLLEGGVRQRDGGGLIVTCRLARPGQTGSQTLRVEAESGGLADVRNRLVEEIAKAVGVDRGEGAGADLADEAVFFAVRRDRLQGAYRHDQAAEMAEAALILAPTPQNLREALAAYYSLAGGADGQQRSEEGLRAACRHHQLVLEWLRKTAVNDPLRQGLPGNPFVPHVRFPLAPESEDVSRLRDLTNRLSLEHFDLRMSEAQLPPERQMPLTIAEQFNRADRQLDLLFHRLEHAVNLAKTGRQFSADLPKQIEQIERRLHEIKAVKSPPDASYERFFRLVLAKVGASRSSPPGLGLGFRSDGRAAHRADQFGVAGGGDDGFPADAGRGRPVHGRNPVRAGLQRADPGLCAGDPRTLSGQRSALARADAAVPERLRHGDRRLARRLPL